MYRYSLEDLRIMLSRILIFILVFFGLASHVNASGRSALKPRVESNLRAGTDRTISMNEFWVPFHQDATKGSVFYGDLRMMGDNEDNRELNVGVGYREMVNTESLGQGVLGGHVWFDRRKTSFDSKFNQITVGGEWFSDDWDIKVNGYIPLNKDKTFERSNPNGLNAQFVGNQILVNTNQIVVEEALMGADLELGMRVPFLDDYTDSTRIYAAAFHFQGDRAEDVSGWRARISSDITEDFQIGARFQTDDVRGSQSFLEATVRFPFGNKQSYKDQGLWARMDESPERDIDIVSNEAVLDQGNNVALLNSSTSTAQNVIHVDNTVAGGGAGTNESRFNTLAAAQAAAGANDIIYVHRGDGTTAGMNAGITIDDAGQKLVGAGVNLTLSDFGLISATGIGTNSDVLIAASSAPVITNGAGDGITVTADDVKISGLTVSGATGNGIELNYSAAQDHSVEISNVTSTGNGEDGIEIRTSGTANLASQITNSTFSNNTDFGVFYFLQGAGTGSQTVNCNTMSMNGRDGVRMSTRDTFIADFTLQNNNSSQNTEMGYNLRSEGTGSNTFTVKNNTSSSNTTIGLLLRQIDGLLTANLESNVITGNGSFGVAVDDDAAALPVIDLGGGALGSAGNNSIFSNVNQEVFVDLDGGELKAENNWWGVSTGLDGGEVSLNGASTIDADPFLIEAPE